MFVCLAKSSYFDLVQNSRDQRGIALSKEKETQVV
jgi:hypothetical protein